MGPSSGLDVSWASRLLTLGDFIFLLSWVSVSSFVKQKGEVIHQRVPASLDLAHKLAA